MDFSAVTTNSGTDTRTDAREGPRPSGAASSRRARQRGREWRVLTGLVALLLGAVAAGLAVGAVAISPGQVLAILGDKGGPRLFFPLPRPRDAPHTPNPAFSWKKKK